MYDVLYIRSHDNRVAYMIGPELNYTTRTTENCPLVNHQRLSRVLYCSVPLDGYCIYTSSNVNPSLTLTVTSRTIKNPRLPARTCPVSNRLGQQTYHRRVVSYYDTHDRRCKSQFDFNDYEWKNEAPDCHRKWL